MFIVTSSWDDGSFVDLKVAELLEKYGIKGTFYIPQTLFAHPLTPENIRQLDRSFEIGGHTSHHVDLTRLPVSQADLEIRNSKAYLEGLLGHEVAMFSYPSGRYNREVKKLVRNAGFIAARTTRGGNLKLPADTYEWHPTLYTSFASPYSAVEGWLKGYSSLKNLFDWEKRAEYLFDRFLKNGGIYHFWGHSLSFEVNLEWGRFEKLLKYIAHSKNILHLTNGEVINLLSQHKQKL